jgi:hypothetical protein
MARSGEGRKLRRQDAGRDDLQICLVKSSPTRTYLFDWDGLVGDGSDRPMELRFTLTPQEAAPFGRFGTPVLRMQARHAALNASNTGPSG